jgi:hypothetical protein
MMTLGFSVAAIAGPFQCESKGLLTFRKVEVQLSFEDGERTGWLAVATFSH